MRPALPSLAACWLAGAFHVLALAQTFQLPTSNRSLLDLGRPSERFLVGTAGIIWLIVFAN